jgi:endogenous inhibitor of DNA gyrase (YacG/DUF329 family)
MTAAQGKCPLCGKPRVMDFRPFCSKRCANIDLSRWLSGSYAMPAEEDDASIDPHDDDEPPAP